MKLSVRQICVRKLGVVVGESVQGGYINVNIYTVHCSSNANGSAHLLFTVTDYVKKEKQKLSLHFYLSHLSMQKN